jgi:hypothetical protein
LNSSQVFCAAVFVISAGVFFTRKRVSVDEVVPAEEPKNTKAAKAS